ncbi:methyltransferase [Planctomycetota bacterium]|nr:methyltransferase [Planctomycetota bacterium]
MSGLTDFLQHLNASCNGDNFVRLVLASPVDPAAEVQRIQARLIELKGSRHLSFTLREARRDTTENMPLPLALAFVERQLRGLFRSATLSTMAADWQLHFAGDKGGRLIRHRASAKVAPPRGHDEKKTTYLGESALPWLRALSIVDGSGRARPKLADKHSQIDRYVEILAHLAQDCGWQRGGGGEPLRIVDVGCGKGHLTFAAWHLGKHVLGRAVEVTGVEARAELVLKANILAREVAGPELQFVQGDIEHVPLPNIDVLVALHACNTATDHAIRRGVQSRARLIVVAPCCHQEVRPQLASPEPLAEVMRHGILAEKMAEWATDGLRALVLEWAGYSTKVIEFVSSEHTGKNLMIAGVRGEAVPEPEAKAKLGAKIAAFREFFGIRRHALDALLTADG